MIALSIALTPQEPAAAIRVAPDESYSVAELIARGAPATDREWNASDLQRVADLLGPIAANEPTKLPRFDSQASGRFMARLASDQNFGLIHDHNIGLQQRLAETIALSQAIAKLTGVYIAASNQGAVFDREMVELEALIVKVNLEVWSGVDELRATLSEEQLKAREGGMAQIRSGSAEVIEGLITTFTETNVYRLPELRRLAGYVVDSLPKLGRRLTPEASQEMRVRLAKVAAETKDPELHRQLQKMLEQSR